MKKYTALLTAVILALCCIAFSGMAEEAAEEPPAEGAGADVLTAEEPTEEIEVSFPDNIDEEDLAGDYIARKMPSKRRLRAERLSGISLAEPNRSLYFALRTRILSVAAGDTGSTVFTIPAAEVFKQRIYYAEDLEVEAIDTGTNFITAAAASAFAEVLDERVSEINFPAVLQCLMNDCPYEMYWFNKSYLPATNTFRRGAIRNQETDLYDRLVIIGDITITLHVSQDYATYSYADGEVVYSRTEVDPGYGESVISAAANAQEILDGAAELADDEKLSIYRDAICALSEYNREVGENTPYGDPWQMVWVFDGKPNTKVVCEGYAKAFQYLCTQGTAEATAISVQGKIPAGAHMWNIVAIGGHNYLVDLTNYDLGYDLFMKGYTDGDVENGYFINHGYGTMKYTYNTGLGRSDEELTLYGMDYSEWKEAVEKVPEIEVSSETTYAGYLAAARIVNEEGDFAPEALVISREGEEDVTVPIIGEVIPIPCTGEMSFAVIRDGAESLKTEQFAVTEAEMPAEQRLKISGMRIEEEAFAGDSAIRIVEATDCQIASHAFAECGNLEAAILEGCSVEEDSFEPDVVLCLDEIDGWRGYRFVLQEQTEGQEREVTFP